MIFSVIIGVISISIILFFVFKWRKSKRRYVFFLETSTPTLESYRNSEVTKKRYFSCKEGRIDLRKHPELIYFKEVGGGSKEYLVQPWKKDHDLYIKQGETRAVVFEIIPPSERNQSIVFVPCLRTIDTIIEEDTKDFLNGYKNTSMGVRWDKGVKIVDSKRLIGIVKYESF